MIARLLVLVFVITAGSTSRGWTGDLEQAARDAVAAHRHREAAALYEQLSASDPANADYFVWIGRLAGWVQDYPAAIAAYERALARAPQRVEALVGRALVLMWRQKFAEAHRDLSQAEQLAPRDADVQLALARFHHFRREDGLASARVRMALALAPENREARELQSQLVLPRPLEVSIGYGRHDFSFAPAGNLGFITAGYVGPHGRIAFQYERWNKFGETVDRTGVDASRRLGDRLWVRSSAMFAPGATVLARQDYSAGFSRTLPRGFVVGADYRNLQLVDALVHVASPGVEYYVAHRPVWLQAVFSESWTRFDAPVQAHARNSSVLLRYNQQVGDPLVLHVGYAKGDESFAALSIDRLGSFRANTYSGGVDVRIDPARLLAISYADQERSSGARERTLEISVKFRK